MTRTPDKLGPYLRIGTCSWKYDSWKGLLYEPEKDYAPNDYLNRQKMPSLEVFIEKLDEFFARIPGGFEYAVEIRNPNYLKPAWFDFLKDRGVNSVLLEGYYMPAAVEVAEKFDTSSGDISIIRLMGPDRQGIEKLTAGRWDRIVSAKDDSLESIARIVKGRIEQTRQTIVNVNNHYEGCAVLTIDRLIGILGDLTDKVIVISGDTRPCDNIVKYGKGADILVHEVYCKETFDTKNQFWQNYHSQNHTSTYELGELANKIKPRLTILYHVLSWGAKEEDLLKEISEVYSGKVVAGRDLGIY